MNEPAAVQDVMESTAEGLRLRVKVVPGSSRNRLAGVLGDRLKVQVSAAPEAGRANAAVCALLARTLSVGKRQVQVVSGHSQPQKVVEVTGLTLREATERLKARQATR